MAAALVYAVGCGGSGSSEAAPSQPVPVAAFTASPATATVGQTVAFSDATTNSPTSWLWNFGDGATSALQNPSHAFVAAGTYTVVLTATGPGGSGSTSRTVAVTGAAASSSWTFAVVGDTHVASSATSIPAEVVASILADRPSLVLVPGDIVEAGLGATKATLRSQLEVFKTVTAPLTSAGIPIYPIRGNHENDSAENLAAWSEAFSGSAALPANGPAGQVGLTYAFTRNNALFVGLDDYVDLHRVDQAWLEATLAANTRPHVFVFGHEPAFKVRHDDCLDDHPTERNAFWSSLSRAGAQVYFCGHDHFFDASRIDDGDGNPGNDLVQLVVGTGGGSLFSQYASNGDNAPYAPKGLFHEAEFGYLLVEVSGSDSQDLGVKMTWKKRTVSPASGAVSYTASYSLSYTATSKTVSYPVVDTGETDCYGTGSAVIPAPEPGQPFYGQDPQFSGLQPAYRDHGDGTVSDLNTGLMWVKARGARMSWADALAGAQACRVGGYADWRMPTVKELYSLILFTGAQGPSMTSTAGYVPFIDAGVFEFRYGAGTSAERVIDAQDWSATPYVSTTMLGSATAFGVNFADGRIKGYPSATPSVQDFVRYVRGNPAYGVNRFLDQGDGTVTDAATGLMWSREDSGAGMDWETALAWVQQRNAAGHLGHRDWRMPNTKELQSLVDYTRAPDAADAGHRGPALDPVFACTAITNEGGALDYPYFWTGTNFKDGTPDGVTAAYICFGRALGYMKTAGSSSYRLLDVHGAGTQRSDPKSGSVTDFLLGTDAEGRPVYGRGPQGDVVRIRNFVRLVRNAD